MSLFFNGNYIINLMKSIIIYINTASYPIFQRNTKTLIENYKHTIERHGLNIKVITVTGRREGRNDYFEDIIIDCDESEILKVNLEAIKIISKDYNQYDIIVKQNTNTVLNLQLLQLFCDLEVFNDDFLYSICYFNITGFPDTITFPSGMFFMSSLKIFDKIIEYEKNTIDYINQYFEEYDGTKNFDGRIQNESIEKEYLNNCLRWKGMPDDIFIGITGSIQNIYKRASIRGSTLSEYKRMDEFIKKILENNISIDYIAINCKMESCVDDNQIILEEKWFRENYEYKLIDSICKLFDNSIITKDMAYNLYLSQYFY